MANLRASIIIDVINRGTNSIRTATHNFGALRKSAERAGKAFQLAGSISQAGGAVSQLGSAFDRAWKTPLSLASELESTMSDVRAKARASAAETADLEAQARQLGATSAFTASQAAEGQAFLAMTGFKTQQILKTMPGMLNLASAASMDLARTADITSNIMGGFGISADEAARVSDTLAAVLVRSNVDLEMLGTTMSYVAPVAAGLGVSLETTATLAGMLGNVGIQGSQGGTVLRAMLQRLSAPTKTGAQAMRRLGVEIADATGKMKDPAVLLAELTEAMSGLSDIQQTRALKSIFGVVAGSGAAALMKQAGSGGITQLHTEVSNATSEAARVAQQKLDNYKGAMLGLVSALEEVGLAAGKTVLPTFRSTVELLRQGAMWAGGFASRWPRLTKYLVLGAVAGSVVAGTLATLIAVLGTGATAFAAMAYATGGAITGLELFNLMLSRTGLALTGRFLWSLGAATLGMVGIGTGSWAAVPGLAAAGMAIKGVGIAIMTTPVGWIAGAIALIAGGAYLIWKNWNKLGNWLKLSILVALGPISWLIVAVGTIRKHWGAITGFVGGIWSDLKYRWLDGVSVISGALAPVFEAAGRLTKYWEPVAEFFSSMWLGIKFTFTEALEWITEKTAGLRKAADSIVAFLPDWVGGGGGGAEEEEPETAEEEAVAEAAAGKRRKPSGLASGAPVQTIAPSARDVAAGRGVSPRVSPSRVELVVKSELPIETRRMQPGTGIDLSVDTGYAHGGAL